MTDRTKALDELIAGNADLYDVPGGAMTPEQCVMVCPQCEGEGTYADGLDDAACSTICTRCEGNGWIVDVHSYNYASAKIVGDADALDETIINELRALHVWPQFVADYYADILSPCQIKGLYNVGDVAHRAADAIASARITGDKDRRESQSSAPTEPPEYQLQFPLRTRVRKISGPQWEGVVVGYYSSTFTPEGLVVECTAEGAQGQVHVEPAKRMERV